MSTDPLPSADVATVLHRVATILHHESRSASGFAAQTVRPQDAADYTAIAALFDHFTLGLLNKEYDDVIRDLIGNGTTGATR